MKAKGPVWCRPKDIGTPNQIIKRKRGGTGKSNSGPTGWKNKPGRILAQAIAKSAAQVRARMKKKV